MIGGPVPPLRNDRTTAARGTLAAPRGSSASSASGSDLSADDQSKIASQRQAFDFEAAERAEIEREHEVLQALLMAFLKNEDEITKKWIALI
jgi:hypothetical protein